MDRRAFLRRTALVLPALVVGDEALELFARLTHQRRSFPSAAIAPPQTLIELAQAIDGNEELRAIVDLLAHSNRLLAELPWRTA